MNESKLNVLVVGCGGREHALCAALAASPRCRALFAAPGNPGMARLATCVPLAAADLSGLTDFCRRQAIDLAVVGPEAPLAAGLADQLRQSGVAVFGPGASAARLEADKAFAKDFMTRRGVPTARSFVCRTLEEAETALARFAPPYVVKATGLAAGKGVIVDDDLNRARSACRDLLESRKLGDAGATVLVEEGLRGRELSVMIVTDGDSWRLLPLSQDHKRLLDGDQGPNTGGMGAYAPLPWVGPGLMERIVTQVVKPSVAGLSADGLDFRGVLYAGLMVSDDGRLDVLEYNVRLGDPEAEVLIPLYGGDWLELCLAVARRRLAELPAAPSSGATLGVVLASAHYPAGPSEPAIIEGLDDAAALPGISIFHCGTTRKDGGVWATGGRVLCVVARADDHDEAAQRAYRAADLIRFDGCQKRCDIGHGRFGKELG